MIKKRSSSLTTRLLIKTTDFSHGENCFCMKGGDRNYQIIYIWPLIRRKIFSERVFKRKMIDNCVLPKRLGYNHQRQRQKDRLEAISSFVAVVYWMLTLKDAKTGLASKQDEENISKYKQVSKRFRGELKFRRNYQKERSKVRRKQFNQSFSLLLSKGKLIFIFIQLL